MSGQATVTAPIGAGVTATAQVIQNARGIDFDTIRGVLNVTAEDGRVISFDITATTTITATAAAGVFTFTIQQ